jgi:hypothetical protein
MSVRLVATLAAVGLALFVLDRFLLWCESRGWIYYRRTRRRPGLGTSPIVELMSVYHPAQKHILEQRVEAEDDQDGESKDGGRPDGPHAGPT